jgi:hypothetical protein
LHAPNLITNKQLAARAQLDVAAARTICGDLSDLETFFVFGALFGNDKQIVSVANLNCFFLRNTLYKQPDFRLNLAGSLNALLARLIIAGGIPA